jgi:peptidoglycan LD-endopeptidase LytH
MVGRILVLLLLVVPSLQGQGDRRLQIVWPTPNPAYAEGRPHGDFVQPTVSGRTESAFFGCVRNSGARFHEGIDLKPIARDARGEAVDPIYAVMPGLVAYVNHTPGNSGYGRYIIIEHREADPPVITLYAHLSAVDDVVVEGKSVSIGQTIGTMGRSAGGYTIPRERAHLHFEIGFWLTEDFQEWYDWRRFGTPNQHGLFNGMNMIGFDPYDFYNRFRAGEVAQFYDYLALLPVAFTVQVKSERMPDFVRRYPTLIEGGIPSHTGGWQVDFTSYGLPKAWRAIAAGEPALAGQREQVRVISHNAAVVREHACRNALVIQRGRATVGSHTERILQLMFGFR